MIDCSRTENYFAEKRRMTKKHKLNVGAYICELNCTDCPLSSLNNDTSDKMSCSDFESIYPEKAIAIIQKWSDEHPQKTYLTELLEKYPNVLLNDDDTPEGMCPHQLGLKDSIADCKIGYDCVACWNQPIEE
ncbi:hypothetical protein [Ruminococcus sp.]|uniref:hypothetical protein n=1 Tax=Ruminococcus sp. TaxID=41978 RepID=UPI003F8129AB